MESNIHEMDIPPSHLPPHSADTYFTAFFSPSPAVFLAAASLVPARLMVSEGRFQATWLIWRRRGVLRRLMGDLAMLLPVAARLRLESESSPS